MWVLIKKPYAGVLGLYPGDQKHDLPEKTIAGLRDSLGKENVVDTCAPWEEHVDKKAVDKAEAISKANAATKDVKQLIADIARLKTVISSASKELQAKQSEVGNAVKRAEKLAKAAGINGSTSKGKAAGNAKG